MPQDDAAPAPDESSDDLTEFEQQVVDLFEQRGGEGPDDSSPSPGGEGGVESPPDRTTGGDSPDLSFVEPADESVDALTAEGGDAATPPSAEPDVTPDPTDFNLSEVWEGATADDIDTAKRLYDWYGALDPAAIQQIDATLSGQYILVPAAQVQQLQESWNLLEKVKRGEFPGQPARDVDPFDDDEEAAPSAELEELRQRLEYTEQQLARQQVDEQVAQAASVIDNTAAQWRGEHEFLSDEDMAYLEQAVIQSGVYGPLSQQYDPATATRMALDQMLYSVPQLRDKVLQTEVDARIQNEMAAVQEQQARGQRASAISGASPAPPSSNAASLDPDEAMIEEIAQHLRNG